jgi:hypothetical protein
MKKLITLMTGLVVAATGYTASAQDDLKVIIDTDFSTIFTDGTEAEPGDDIATSLYSGEFYTKTDKVWRGSKVHSAGGCIWVEDNGYIESSYLTGASTSTPIRVTMVVRSGAEYGGGAQFGISTTTNTEYLYDDQWTTITTIFSGGSSYSRVKVSPYLAANGIYIKSIKVESSSTFVAPTTAYQPSDADGTSFTARWKAVTDAAYQLDVYSYDADGSKKYLLQNQLVDTNSYKVSGLDANTTYYYVVRVVKGDNVSANSEEIEVVKVVSEIAAPTGLKATDVTDNGFTASWNAVEDAISYIVNYYETSVTTEAGIQTIFDEDFSGINFGTFSSVSFSGDLNDYTKQTGWETDFSKAFCEGNFVIYPYGSNNSVITPAIDLAANNGAFTVNLNLAEANYGTYKTGGTVTVSALDSEDNVLSTATITIDTAAYKLYSVDLTGGNAATRIKLTYTDGNKLYIDEISVAQMLPAGSTVTKVVEIANTENTSYTFNQPKTADAKRSFTVQSVARTVVSSEITTISSVESEAFDVESASGVETITIGNDTAKAWKSAVNELTIEGNNATIYDLSGRVIASVKGNATIAIDNKGVVIAVVDGKSYKFIF